MKRKVGKLMKQNSKELKKKNSQCTHVLNHSFIFNVPSLGFEPKIECNFDSLKFNHNSKLQQFSFLSCSGPLHIHVSS